jgi:hypothetical protein
VNPIAIRLFNFFQRKWAYFKEKGTQSFLEYQLSWIQKEYYPDFHITLKNEDKLKTELIRFLHNTEKEKIINDQMQFRKNFTSLAKQAFGERKNDRKDRSEYGAKTIKNILLEQNLGFTLNTSRTGWCLCKNQISTSV